MATIDAERAHQATEDERSDVVATLVAAFVEDPIYRWIVPDDDQRRRSAESFYSLLVDAYWPHGGVYAAGGRTGAALWLPPERQLVDGDRAEAFGRELVETAGDKASCQRQIELVEMLDEHHPSDPHWYLAFMGVRPSLQGHGIGSVLLRAVLENADRNGVPAYLEASCPANKRLYERHGFETVRELTVADSPPLYAMWRRPAG
ncbi:hypothetical protein AU193_01085 [Mycobacterium sp. GA-1285]|uniref:GNAT family N-acetyltransferase n=1 Tax=Mycobacterium sp. GA-1285 TaxID=1772282 RepID=UPI0007494D69|nr:GNAT family N-acetyltransferase [Mycobacterium sp. GA-1285]KUI23378.1 hypothetical protein AU193_01085 [Mycobacterium sp. GA-1285]